MKVEPLPLKPACMFHKGLLSDSEKMGSSQSTTSKTLSSVSDKTLQGRFLVNETERKWFGLLNGSIPTPKKTNTVIKAQDVYSFLKLLEEPDIFLFISHDVCKVLADKYLLAVAFVLIIRAGYPMKDVNHDIFYAALYLAHDMEEDLDQKLEILPYALGKYWRNHYIKFGRKKEEIWEQMNYRALVSRKCCDDVMAQFPDHWAWKRERAIHHSEAVRILPTICLKFKGPDCLPEPCIRCKDLQETNSNISKSASEICKEKESELEDFIRRLTPDQQAKLPEHFAPLVTLDQVPWSLLSKEDQQMVLKYYERQGVQPPTGIDFSIPSTSRSTFRDITNLIKPVFVRVNRETKEARETRVKRPSRLSTFFQESPILKRTK